jgi:hypothetical protein
VGTTAENLDIGQEERTSVRQTISEELDVDGVAVPGVQPDVHVPAFGVHLLRDRLANAGPFVLADIEVLRGRAHERCADSRPARELQPVLEVRRVRRRSVDGGGVVRARGR